MLVAHDSTHPSTTMDTLTLFCLVDKEPSSSAFPVSIATAKTIGELKDAIKAKKSPEFNDIAADKLTLWKVSIPSTEDEDESPIILGAQSDRNKLVHPTSKIAKYFQDGADGEHIHIIIQRPFTGNYCTSVCDPLSKIMCSDFFLSTMAKHFQHIVLLFMVNIIRYPAEH
jgi:hypothetical protein